jgi:hypothetical protein
MSFETECAGKHKYASQSLVAMIVGHKQGAKLESYKCQHCNFFHVREAKEPVRVLKKSPTI